MALSGQREWEVQNWVLRGFSIDWFVVLWALDEERWVLRWMYGDLENVCVGGRGGGKVVTTRVQVLRAGLWEVSGNWRLRVNRINKDKLLSNRSESAAATLTCDLTSRGD